MQGAPPGGGGGEGGGAPGEGGGGSGGSGSGGGSGPSGGGGLGGETNTNTGNKLSSLGLAGWASRGDSGVAFTLSHNSLGTYDDVFGHGWSHSYSGTIAYTAGSSAIIRMPDGLTVPYTETAGAFSPPVGWNASLVRNAGGDWTLTFKNRSKWEFDSSGRLSAVKDKSGNSTTLTRNGSGDITAITSADGRALTLAYDAGGRVSSITDPISRVWSFTYNGSGQLTGVTYPALGGNSYTRAFTYNSTHDILTETDLRGKVWSWTYDSSQRMTSYSTPLSHTTSYSYGATATTITLPGGQSVVHNYSSGLLASAVDPASFSQSYTYDADRNVLTKTDKRGKVWTYTYDANGNVLTAKNPLNQTTTYTYSAQNDLLTAKNALNQTTTYAYDSSGRLTLVTDPLGRAAVRHTYDGYGNLATTKDALNRTTTLTHNLKGELTQSVDPASISSTLGYDGLSRVVWVKDAANNQTSLTYDAWGRSIQATHPGGASISIAYDLEGSRIGVTDEIGRTVTWAYDDSRRLTSHTNGRGDTETYAYNSNGWMTSVTNGRAKTRTYTHTTRGDTASLTMADGAVEQWTYNGEGQTSAYVSPMGYTVSYGFDDAGRSTLVDYPTGTDTTFAYDAAGRRTSMVDATGTTTWTYNSASELTGLNQPQGNLTYAYNSAGQRTTVTEVGLGSAVTTFDSAGRPASVTNRFSEATSFTYDSLGRVSKKTFSSGTYEDLTYDSRNRLTSITVKNSAGTLLRAQSYAYDNASQVTTHTMAGVPTTYTYDAAGQLTSESRTGYTASYTYDGNGNRLTKIRNGVTENYSYDDGDKLLSVAWTGGSKTYGYDAAGRTTSIVSPAGTTTLSYDFESRVTSLSGPGVSQTNTYNGLDTRVSKIENGASQTFVRDGAYVTDPVLRDSSAAYTPGISERRGSVSTFQHSGIKNAASQSTVSGSLSAFRVYDAFGNLESGGFGAWQGPFGYAGSFGYQEDGPGLRLLGHRYYDSSTGRFLTRDPIKDGRNWYGYSHNSPLTRSDPTGLVTVGDMEFTWGGYVGGLQTGWAAVGSSVTMGLWDGGEYKDKPGFGISKGLADIGFAIMPLPGGKGGAIGRACFTPGTLILMANGTKKAIEDIEFGDVVATRSEGADPDSRPTQKRVIDTFSRVSATITLLFSDGSTVETTSEHPFYVLGRGFAEASSLSQGDEIASDTEQPLKFVRAVASSIPKTVYNFTVASTHTYFVVTNDKPLWVHNACKPDNPGWSVGGGNHNHHIVPQWIAKQLKHIDESILSETVPLPAGWHTGKGGLHSGTGWFGGKGGHYNEWWDHYIQSNGGYGGITDDLMRAGVEYLDEMLGLRVY